MDILYYSNHCKHSQKVLQYLVKNNLSQKFNCLCIDQRVKDPHTGQIHIVLDRGTKLLLPPNIQSVPSLLLMSQKNRVVVGEDIFHHLNPQVKDQNMAATGNNGEPIGYLFSNVNQNVVSEQYTYYNMSPDELSSKGRGGQRQMHNYAPATLDTFQIPTPEETYRADKIGEVSMDSLQQKRNQEIIDVRPPAAIPDAIYAPTGPPSSQKGGKPIPQQNARFQDSNIGLQPPAYASQQNSVYGQNQGFSNTRNPNNSPFLVNI